MMIGRLNHVAIAVPDLEAAADQYRNALGANVGPAQDEPDHGVTEKLQCLVVLCASPKPAGVVQIGPVSYSCQQQVAI